MTKEDIHTIYGADLPESKLAAAMKKCTVVRQRKLYPMVEIMADCGQAVTDDMLAWVVRLEDHAIVQAVASALKDGRLTSGIVLSADGVEELLNKQIPAETFGWCPTCHEPVRPELNAHFCGNCGQAILWTGTY